LAIRPPGESCPKSWDIKAMISHDELPEMRQLVRQAAAQHGWDIVYTGSAVEYYAIEFWRLQPVADPMRSLVLACMGDLLSPGFICSLGASEEYPTASGVPGARGILPIGPHWREEVVGFLANLIEGNDIALEQAMTGSSGVIRTSAAWASADDLRAMLRAAAGHISLRKHRLLACAFCRLVWHDTRDRRNLRAIETAERYADGLATARELSAARAASRGLPQLVTVDSFTSAFAVAEKHADPRDMCDRIREVLGDPFAPVRLDWAWLRWNDGCVGKMVRAIWRGQRFAELPILADALEEAGCQVEPLLRHFREPRIHVRGCWGLDLLLSKDR
jgi:hypothetical protein